MAQHDYVISNGTGAAVRSDLNNALAAIVSQNSGATAPSPTYAFQFWADTTAGVLKLRNSANSAWITLFQLDGEWTTLPVENGTAAAPSIYFKDSGTDTGFYSPGTDQVAISTGGTGRLFINSSGSVGIGTSSPSTLFHCAGIARIGANDANDAELQIGAGATGNRPAYIDFVGDTTYTDYGLRVIRNSTGANANSLIAHRGTGDLQLNALEAGAIGLFTNDTQRLRITSAGNVGIGTASPGVLLDLSSATAASRLTSTTGTNPSYINFNNTAGNAYIGIESSTGGGAAVGNAPYALHLSHQGAYPINFSTNNALRATIDSSGRLLVGTSSDSSTALLTVKGQAGSNGPGTLNLATSQTTSYGNGSVLGRIRFGETGSAVGGSIELQSENNWTGTSYPSRLVFSTTADGASSPTERMRISNNGVIDCFVSGGEGLALHSAQSAGNSVNFFVGYYGATGINGTASYVVRTNGNVLNTNGSYTAISDQKLKENIVDANSQWSDLKAIKIRNWNFKTETGHETHRQIGPIAQELEQVCPGLVFEIPEHDVDGEAIKGVNQSILYMKAVKALQEAMERIEQLEAKVAALESA